MDRLICRIQDGFAYMSGDLTGMAARRGSAGTVNQNDFMRFLQHGSLRGQTSYKSQCLGEQGRICMAFCDPVLEVTQHHFSVLFWSE